MTDVANTTPLNFDDVVAAVGDGDPAQTNASKIRSQLGRGSFATIQRHLDTMRAQRIQAQQPEAVPVPAAPPELLQMWGAAVQIATAQVRTRLDTVVQERDTRAGELLASRSDAAALTGELERLLYELEVSEQAAGQAANQARAAGQARADDAATVALTAQVVDQAHAAALSALRGELEAAQHQVATAKLEAQLGAHALQSTVDRLTDQIGDLKSLLHSPGRGLGLQPQDG